MTVSKNFGRELCKLVPFLSTAGPSTYSSTWKGGSFTGVDRFDADFSTWRAAALERAGMGSHAGVALNGFKSHCELS